MCATDSLVPAQPMPETLETVRRLYGNWPDIAITSLQWCITDLDVFRKCMAETERHAIVCIVHVCMGLSNSLVSSIPEIGNWSLCPDIQNVKINTRAGV